jgi:molybdate transport repressor ModE-like protein
MEGGPMQKNAELAARLSPYAESQAVVSKRVPDWDDFRVLMAVVKMGSFNRAADTLGLTQPTVSRRIAALEKAIGAHIVDRDCSGAVLTLEGQRIFDELNIAHNALERAINRTQARQLKEVVKLVIADGLAAHWVMHFLPFLYRQHPELELRILTANSATDRNGHHDLSVHCMSPADPDMIATRLGTLHFIPYASATYLAEYGHPTTLSEFANHRLLDFILYLVDNGSWITRLPDCIAQDRTQLFTNSGAVLAEAVRKGNGIALLATYESLFDDNILPINVDLHLETPFWLCYHQEVITKRSVQITIRFLRHIFDRKTMPWFGDQFFAPASFPAITPETVMRSFLPASPADAHASANFVPTTPSIRRCSTSPPKPASR